MIDSMSNRKEFIFTKLENLLNEPDEDISYIWEDTLIKGGLSLLVAKPKVGKSTLARNLAFAIANGEPAFLGRKILCSGSIVYLALEEKRTEVKRHFELMGATSDLPIYLHIGMAPDQAIEKLRTAIVENRAIFAIVDPLQRLSRIKDLNNYSEVSITLEPIMQIARDTGCHIMLVHHANKSSGGENGDCILGSTAIYGSVDCALFMRRSGAHRTLESNQRYGTDFPQTILALDADTGIIDSGGNIGDLQIAECGKVILDILSSGECSASEIKNAITSYNHGVIIKSLRALCVQGRIICQGSGKKGNPYIYKLYENSGDSGDGNMAIPTIPTNPDFSDEITPMMPAGPEPDGNKRQAPIDETSDQDTSYNISFDDFDRRYEKILRMPVSEAIEIWRSHGAPSISLAIGSVCNNIERLLSLNDVPDWQLISIRDWLNNNGNGGHENIDN